MDLSIVQQGILLGLEKKGITAAAASNIANGNPSLIKNIMAGHVPRIDSLMRIAEALDMDFYFGIPRPENLYLTPRDTDSPEIPEAHLTGLERQAQGLVRFTVEAGGNPIPDDLREGLIGHAAPPESGAEVGEESTSPSTPTNVVEFPGARSGARPIDVVEVAAAAGGGATELDERVTGCVWFRRDWLDRNAIDPTQSVVISVHGESMEPLLPDGSSVLVDRTRCRRSAGRVFVLQTTDGLVVKRLEQQQGVWQLVSEHPDWAPMPWTNGTEIIGEVRWTARTLE